MSDREITTALSKVASRHLCDTSRILPTDDSTSLTHAHTHILSPYLTPSPSLYLRVFFAIFPDWDPGGFPIQYHSYGRGLFTNAHPAPSVFSK